MNNDKPNYAYMHGYFASSLSADVLIMRMRQHGFVLKPDKLKLMRESLEKVCIDIKREAEEGGRIASADFKSY